MINSAILPPPEKTTPSGNKIFRRDGDDLVFTDATEKITARFSRLRQRADGLRGELTLIEDVAPRRLWWGELSLASTSARKTVADRLARDPIKVSFKWPEWLDDLCYAAALAARTDGAFVDIGAADDVVADEEFVVSSLLLRGELNMIFAPSGTGKGYAAIALGLQMSAKLPVLPLSVPDEPHPTLYLDWEWSRQEAARRLRAICRGIDAPDHMITYRRMFGALADQAEVLRTEIRRRGIKFVIIDSTHMACGDEAGDDPSTTFIRLATALRSFEVTTLLLDHPAKAAERGAETPYKSRYKLALCRNIWIARKSYGDKKELHVGFWHHEDSNVPHLPPFGFRLVFDRESWPAGPLRALTFHREDVRDVEGFSDLLTDWQRIERLIRVEPLEDKTIAEGIGKPLKQIQARLSEARTHKRALKLPDGRWALVDQERRE